VSSRKKEWTGGTRHGRLSRIKKTEGGRVDQDLRAYLEEMEARMGEKVETENRQTRVLLEGMHDNIRLLAEGVMGVTERLEEHQAATARGFQEIKEMLSPYCRDLNGRAQRLENDVQFLDRRMKILESKADRQTEDVLESIRKKFGKPQA
jgi:hypothetical protein